jgi:hypothetical protein
LNAGVPGREAVGHEQSERGKQGTQSRDRRDEGVRQTIGDIRVTVWAVAVAVIVGLAAFGWVLLNNK